MNLLKQIENEQMAKLTAGKEIPDFQPGDTVLVNVKVVEGERSRVQAYEGVCIGRAGAGLNENFTVRKISYGEGVERVFPLYSPMIDSIKVVRRGKVRRAKLYYLRGRRGKAARIGEKQDNRAGDEGVDEAKKAGRTVQVMGALEKGTSRYDTAAKVLNFHLVDPKTKEVIPVAYSDTKPANFEEAVSIVAIGKYDGKTFVAEKLLVKCPSKYQGEEVEKQYGAKKA